MNHCHTYHPEDTLLKKTGRVFLIAIIAHIIFTFLEAFFAFYAHSSSLLADAGHNLADIFGLAFGWGANYLQMRRPTDRFSYGYKRTSVLAAFLNSMILIATAVMITVSAIEHLLHPHPVEEIIVIIVAAFGIVLNIGTAFLFHKNTEDLNVKAAFIHLFFDALISLSVVVVGVAIYFTQWYWLDSVVGIFIMLAILFGTWRLFKNSMGLILDAVPAQIDIKKVLHYLQRWPDVSEVHDLHVWGLSTTEVALTAHLVVPTRYLQDNEYLLLAQGLRREFGIHHVTLQIERGTMELSTSCFSTALE